MRKTKDFTPISTKITNAKADFIYEISAHVDGAIYIKQWFDLKGPDDRWCFRNRRI